MGMYCRCNCDGSYVCIGEWYFIREDTSISGSGVGSGIISGGCFQCDMNGRTYAGDTRYVISRNGITLNCECFCNGGYYCYGEKQFENLSCRSCSVYGRRYEGESRFSLVYSGLKLSCQCSCDSSYICYGADSTIVITCPTGSGCLPTTCNQCIVDGARFNGGDEFGTVYKSQNLRCLCGCDGSYYCEGDGGLLISCGVNGRCVEIGCGSCSAFGTTYPGERPFEVYALGMKLTCNCECGGSYECYGYDEEIMVRCRPDGTGCLPSTCAPCLVGRNRYAGLAQFRHNWNGLDMMCTCACDGSYYCTGISEVVEVSCVNGQCRRLGCGLCRVYGEVHEGDSSFPLIYGGMKLQCQCSCDSGYVCRGVTNEIVVQCVGGRGTGCLVGRCLTCSVDGREFAAMSQFRSRYQGIDIQCTCGCDGNSYCVGVTTSIEVSCRGGSCVRIGCKDCSIFGRPYLGGAMFDIIYGGNKITCDCDCDGGYVCKSETGVVIVRCVGGIGSGCLTESCNQCVANNRRYDGGQMFRMDYKGIAVECTCSCDGSYYCTGITEIIEISCGVNGVCQPKGCKTCSLFGRDYEGASQFQLVYSGLVLDCECGCNGDYTCYGEGRTTIFQCRGGIGNCMTRQCQSCQLDNGQTIPAFSEATLRYNNYDVRCQCGCDGSVYCKGVNTGLILTCIGGKCIPIGCSPCMIYGQRFESFSIVDVVTAGYSVRCQCGCSGGYTCSGSGYEIRCVNGTGSGCLVDTCRTCSLNGQTVAGKSVFKYRYNGIDMSCTCGCDGSVFCKGVTEIIEIRCIDGKCYPLNCRTCTIFGQERAPFSRTKYVVQGLEVECACDCDGGYQCFAQGKPVQKCEYGRTCYTNTCRDCVVDGVRRKFEESFPYRYKNKIDMTCRCGCDGTSYCEGVEEVIYVSCIGDTCGQINCGTCSIFGRDYPGDSEFDIVYKGVTVRCGCNCDTSYRCKGHSEEFECAAGKRGGCLPQRCRVCRVNGNSYEGMSSFKYNYQGVDMNCVCGCDGTYACKGVNVVIVIACQRREGCRIISGCRDCDIYGVRVPGNGKGQFLYDGYEMDCQCKCDSSYRCLGTKNETIVDCGPGRSCLTSCGSCRIDGRDYRGNTQFDAVIKEKNMLCQCGCDGSYHCTYKNDGSEYICDKRGTCTWKGCSTCVSDGRRFEAFDKFEKLYDGIRVSCGCNCDGSYRCTGINVTITIVCTGEVCRTEGCRSCTNNGRHYNNGEVYEEAADGSYRKRCRCQCDGSVTCENIVQPQCTNCVIDGKTYKGHSQHRVYRNEVSFICACQCNGQHTCAPEEVRKCPQCLIGNTRYDGNTRFQAVLEGSRMDCSCDCEGRFICTGDGRQCTSEAGCVTVCKQCTIDGQVFRGGATASPLRVFGDDMTCTCGCDGAYECRSPKKVCTLASGCVSTCQECVIGGRRYEGNTRFQAVLERSQMECSCDCEGRFACTGDGRSCTSETGCVSVCKQCTIDGQSFRGGAAAFAARVFGDNMTCTCGCDGVYECRSPKKVCTLARGCVSTCQECVIGGRRYEGNTRFQAVLERSQMECSCDCVGRFVCTGDGRSCTSETGCVSVCKQCKIDGQSFRGGAAAFAARVFGDNMTCTCGCDGVYECRSPTKVCTLARGCVSTCQECVIGGRRYEGNTRFQAVLERSRMECSCECDGRFVCTGDGRRCTSETGCVTECKQCTIDGQVFRGAATAFAARVFGEDMTCTCACDGVYECRSLTRVCTLARGCVTTCQECAIGGRRYPGGSTAFDAVIDGTTMRCSCDCNGGYDCRSPNRRCTPTACVDICFACSIAGREYESGTTFDATLDATQMRCTCDCQGNYECRGSNKLCTPSGCVSTCQSCTIGGRQYSGGTTFDADFDGTRMRCSCDCLGSYECTGGDGRICTTLRGCYRECRECVINGRRYNRPDVEFQADVGGVRMTCRCDCVGGYRCVSEGRVCTDLSGCTETCPGCVIEGRRYAGNTQFEIFHSSYGINMQCACECGGSYKCNGTKQTQKCFGDGCPVNGCNECEIDGRRYAGNSRFEAMIDNVRMQCTCSCSGNYRCEGNVTDTKCYGTGCSEVTGPCGQCNVRGKWYAGNTQFAVLNDDGIVMECTCECNGRHTCVGKRSITVCDESGCKNTGESCLSCIVDDREVPGNTRFQRTERGIDMDCVCKCTGEYKCEGRRVICEGPNCGTSGCKRCVIDGVPYTGNTRFNYKKGNAEHLCTCFCDGTHSCTGSGFEISCLGGECAADKCRNCVLDNTEYQLDSRFRLQKEGLTMSCVCECDGAYRCFSISGTCLGKECDSYGCKSCSVDGRSYAANSEFELNGKMVCTCACDGQYNCRSKHFAVTCTGSDCGTQGSSCKRCNVDGDIYEGNSRFQITKYGLFMQCACNCDSTYTCRGYQIISTGERPEEVGCRSCEVGDRRINGNTRFQMMVDGERQVCSCNCNGEHSCSTPTSECRNCFIDGREYTSNQDFTLTRNGNNIRCTCQCNGDFVCVGRRIDNTVFDGCSTCSIFGVTYKGDTRFTTDVGGVRMLCECQCSGEYKCRGYRTVTNVLLPAEVKPTDTCTPCYVAGQERPGNSRFQIQRSCYSIDCICGCDGNWDCPQQVPRYTCTGKEPEFLSEARQRLRYSIAGSHVYTSGARPSGPDTAVIFANEELTATEFGGRGSTGCSGRCYINDQEYAANAVFVLQDGCLRWSCTCDCNGQLNCTNVIGTDCTGTLGPWDHTQCKPCTAFGGTHAPNQWFTANDTCYRYRCMCSCDGTFECPPRMTVQTCDRPDLIFDPAKNTCRKCVIGENEYAFGTKFQHVDDCNQYECTCKCDGSYSCPGSTAVRVCRAGSGSGGRPVSTGGLPEIPVSTGADSGRTFIAIRPSGFGRSFSAVESGAIGETYTSTYNSGSVAAGSDGRSGFFTESQVAGGGGGSGSSSSGVGSGTFHASGSGGGSSTFTSRTPSPRGGSYDGYTRDSSQSGSSGGSVMHDGCEECIVNGEVLKGGRDFTFRKDCVEHLCECYCNGTHFCDPAKSVNFCEEDRQTEALGCKVGNRVYKTKLFSYVEDCKKHVCRCYSNGSHICDQKKMRVVC
ncbi:hypothetical protein DPMN_031324 [Dreissena polymorpha]|uniref:Uncharacterized protein n=2 Tax=Dreissena polymorpha TaxID=45954 RepID=A0A9D4RH80_DREPO|nr:hypothetical protein DPMN_031324 [Dreissena polymorpha]